MSAVAAVPDMRMPPVEPAAAQALLALAARQLHRAVEELGAANLPYAVLFLPTTLDHACEFGVTAAQVERARQSAWRARRLEMVGAFGRLNPAFGPVHQGCWPGPFDPGDPELRCQRRAQRRELELAMGERFARMLVPFEAEGGAAA